MNRRSWILATALLGWPVLAHSETFDAAPPGGVDDTATLRAAFERCTPGDAACEVRLAPGTYRTGFVIVRGFHGAVRGAGMDATVIEALPGLAAGTCNVPPLGVYSCPPTAENPWPDLLLFLDSDVTMSDLGVRVTAFAPTNGWFYADDWWVDWLKSAVHVVGDARFDRVSFEGGPGTDDVYNLDNGPMVEGGGRFEMRRCRVRNTGNGFEVYGMQGGRVLVGGTAADANVFEASSGGTFLALTASEVEVSFNRIDTDYFGWGGIVWLGTDTPAARASPNRVLLAHNGIRHRGVYEDGIWIQDDAAPRGSKTIDLAIVGNAIEGASPAPWTTRAIGLGGSADALVASNRISGTAWIGIVAGRSSGCVLKANDLQALDAMRAPIVLQPTTHDCVVVGGPLATTVLDLGVNDTLVGVERAAGLEAGPEVSEAMRARAELMLRAGR